MSRLSDLPTNAKDSMYFNKGRGGLSVQNGHGDTNNFHAKFLSVGTVGPDIPVEDSQNEEDYAAQFLRALSVRNPRFDGDDIESQKGDVIPHTYEWLLDDAIFQKWKAAQASQILLIKGLAGVGKTMMMLGLIRELPQQLSRSAAPDIMAYFFCQATNADRNSTVSILKGLIFMLVEQQNSLIHGIMKKYGKDLSEILNGPDILDELGGIIADLTQDSSVGTVYLIIDALDECSDSELLFKVMKSVHRGQSSKAKWLVTSRPVLSLDSLKIDFKIDFKDRSNEIFNSIGVYVDSKVSELARIKILTEEESQQIKDFLKDNSNGTFLWIAIVLREIGLSEPLKIKCELQQLLHSFPADLEKLYKRMAKQIEGSYKNRLLSAMIYAQRPLNLTELAIFTDLDEKIKTKEDFKLLRSQVDHCGSLLIERGETVHLIHQTVKDYFTRSKSPSLWLGDSRNAQAYFATQCLSLMSRHLSANLFCSPNRDIDPSDEIVNTSSPLFQCIKYACVYWVDHLELAGPESYSCVGLCHGGRVHQFMRQNFLHWLEAMAYLGEIPKAKQMISKLLLLVEVHSIRDSLPNMLHDAEAFIQRFQSTISTAPLQVYFTALIFSPQSSSIRRHYWNSRTPWINFRISPPSQEGGLNSLEGHTNNINAVVFSPDGQLIASVSDDSTVRLWDLNSGTVRHTLLGGGMYISAVAFTSDGEKLATGSTHGIITIWSTDKGKRLHKIADYGSNEVESLAISPDSKHIPCGYENGFVKLWSMKDDTESLLALEHGENPITAVAYAPDLKIFASGSLEGSIQVYDSKKECVLHHLKKHEDEVSSLAFSHRGLLASGSFDHTIRLWDPHTGTELASLTRHNHDVHLVTWLKNGQLASASTDGTIRMWNCSLIKTRVEVEEVQTIQLWEKDVTDALEQLAMNWASYGSRRRIGCFAISSDGGRLVASCPDRLIRQWDLSKPEPLKGYGQWVERLQFSPDGQQVAAGSHNGLVKLWDIKSEEKSINSPPLGGCVSRIRFSNDGASLHVTTQSANSIEEWVWTPITGKVERSHSQPLILHPSSVLRVPRRYRLETQWIMHGDKRLFLLPPGMSGISYDCFGNTVAIGYASGYISVFEFVLENLSFPGQESGEWYNESSTESSGADSDKCASVSDQGSEKDSRWDTQEDNQEHSAEGSGEGSTSECGSETGEN